MNILILTPDRVGSTLLQRLITIYANINENYDPLTINLHELTNGLVTYDNPTFKKSVLGKKDGSWGYHQTLQNIAGLVDTCGHDVVSRLAHYHIKNRRDSTDDQLAFYRYLNENFYIIAARRENLFEHAMSWCIAVESKKLNVYSFEEKYKIYNNILKNPVTVQAEMIEKYLNQYREYMDWVDAHFQVNSYFEYERDLPNIEQYILNLRVFQQHKNPLGWADRWDISWADWNRMHYLLSLVPFDHEFSAEETEFMKTHIDLYTQCRVAIQDLQDQGVLVSGVPIKLHTLHQKTQLIANAPECLLHYNTWTQQNPSNYALSYTPEQMNQTAMLEHNTWTTGTGVRLSHTDISKQKLLSSDLKGFE
jgi:hypothetical protein